MTYSPVNYVQESKKKKSHRRSHVGRELVPDAERKIENAAPPFVQSRLLAGSRLTSIMTLKACLPANESSIRLEICTNSRRPTAMAVDHSVKDPFLQSILETSARAREQCMTLIDTAEANAISASHSHSLGVRLELSKQQKLLYSYLTQLRGLNRNAIFGVRDTKQVTAEARQEIDRLHLQLQNLYYEERHLRGEIAACESYEYVPCTTILFPRAEFPSEHLRQPHSAGWLTTLIYYPATNTRNCP